MSFRISSAFMPGVDLPSRALRRAASMLLWTSGSTRIFLDTSGSGSIGWARSVIEHLALDGGNIAVSHHGVNHVALTSLRRFPPHRP